MNEIEIFEIPFFLDSGTVNGFWPMVADYRHKMPIGSGANRKNQTSSRSTTAGAQDKYTTNCQPTPDGLKSALARAKHLAENHLLPDNFEKLFHSQIHHVWQDVPGKPYLKVRFGKMVWYGSNSMQDEVYGVFVKVATPTGAADRNAGTVPSAFDRGDLIETREFNESEKKKFIDLFRNSKSKNPVYPQGREETYPYIRIAPGQKEEFTIPIPKVYDPEHPGELISVQPFDSKKVKFFIKAKAQNGDMHLVDLCIDHGNARVLCLMIEYLPGEHISPDSIRKIVKVVRLKPDPLSGNFYDRSNDVEDGITSSSIVFHENELQTYYSPNTPNKQSGTPPNTVPCEPMEKYRDIQVKRPWFWKRLFSRKYEVHGCVERFNPQIFTEISPVIMGDRAERVLDQEYARKMIERGARVQQSSAKRYYWDESTGTGYINMLLNPWEPGYTDINGELPKMQGELFRFMESEGEIIDLSKPPDPTTRPCPHPPSPKYPKSCTFVWSNLHILEEAHKQMNSAFSGNGDRIPHKLKDIMLTYPSGLTMDHIDCYRKKIQDALNVFNYKNVYLVHDQEDKLTLVDKGKTPDEAVASQLPLVFDRILSYPDQSASDWISCEGKRHKDMNTDKETDSVRILSIDIGGGTTDFAVIEYVAPPKENHLSATVLFADSLTQAGDSLVRLILEKIILRQIIDKQTDPSIREKIVDYFRQNAPDQRRESIRRRILQDCLIPLAIYCLTRSEETSASITLKEANINGNNWKEFVDNALGTDLPAQAAKVMDFGTFTIKLNAAEIEKLVKDLFTDLFITAAMIRNAYDIDLVFVSGKTSENAHIKAFAKDMIPFDSARMIFANEMRPGDWYPFTKNGYISDAKTVTVTGMMLANILSKGMIDKWSLTINRDLQASSNEWGELGPMKRKLPESVFMAKDQNEVTVDDIMAPIIIARRQNGFCSPEPVYKLCRKDSNASGHEKISVTFKRIRDDENGAEGLVITKINGKAYDDQSEYKMILWACSELEQFRFWQDTGKLDISC